MEFPEPVAIGDLIACSNDRDSHYGVTGTMDDAPILFDSIVKPDSYIVFQSIIGRTSNNSGSRFALHWSDPRGRPRSRWGGRYVHVSFERFPNVNFCQVVNSTGVRFYLTFVYLGRDVVDKNYLTNKELAVLVAAMNFAKTYALHPQFTPFKVLSPDEKLFAYGSYIQERHKFEAQVNLGEKSFSNKTSTAITLKSHNGRMFCKSIFEALKGFWTNMDDMCSLDGRLAGDSLLVPWSVKFHTIASVSFGRQEFINLAKSLYTKGAILAQHPGTKDNFSYTEEQTQTNLPPLNGELWGNHMTQMLSQHNACVGEVMDPDVFMDGEAAGIERNGNLLKHPDDKMVPRNMSAGKLIKFYDCGFELKPHKMIEGKCFIPNGPKAGWWVNLLLRGIRHNNTPDNPAETAQSLLELCRQEGDPTLLTALLHYLGQEIPETFDEVNEIIQDLISNPPTDEPGAFDIIILQMLQDYQPEGEDIDADPESGITVDRLLSMIRHAGQRAFNMFGTNGTAASVHSGKIILECTILDDTQTNFPPGTILIEYRAGYSHGVIAGVQVYNPFERVLFMSQVRIFLLGSRKIIFNSTHQEYFCWAPAKLFLIQLTNAHR
jgi:hypothetical protein